MTARDGDPFSSPPGDEPSGGPRSVSRSAAYLQPGQLVVSSRPCAVTTIVGSCVAVCAWDPQLGVGGMNHYLLPHWAGQDRSSPRFGNVAIQRLVDGLFALGSKPRSLRARVYGGACVMSAFRGNGRHLGIKNVELALEMLAERGIAIVTRDVGGDRGRKIVFFTDDGTVSVRKV